MFQGNHLYYNQFLKVELDQIHVLIFMFREKKHEKTSNLSSMLIDNVFFPPSFFVSVKFYLFYYSKNSKFSQKFFYKFFLLFNQDIKLENIFVFAAISRVKRLGN